jgi:hypothetical protein
MARLSRIYPWEYKNTDVEIAAREFNELICLLCYEKVTIVIKAPDYTYLIFTKGNDEWYAEFCNSPTYQKGIPIRIQRYLLRLTLAVLGQRRLNRADKGYREPILVVKETSNATKITIKTRKGNFQRMPKAMDQLYRTNSYRFESSYSVHHLSHD